MAPMCMYSCTPEDGTVQPFHITHYESRAIGQVGLIIVEATAVQPEGRISTKDLGIWSDHQIEGLKLLAERVHSHEAKIGIQLGHAGRKARVNEDIFAPSSIPFNEQMKTPKEMTKSDIQTTISAFKDAAKRAKISGFDVIEIHGAHGYLVNQFLSPLTNKRSDDYGGSLENRYRLLREIIDGVKEEFDGPIFVRISANEYDADGNQIEDFVQIAKWMKEQGVSLIDCSTGGVIPVGVPSFPGYQVPYAEQIKHKAGVPTGAVGLITSPLHAEEIVQNERADLVFLARELLRDPYWPRRAAAELGYPIESPKQYERGWN